MEKLSLYEQVGIVIPGSLLLFGLLLLFPEFNPLFGKDGVTVGSLGIFLVVAYGMGHLAAAAGGIVQWLIWLPYGWPSAWILRDNQSFLSAEQLVQLHTDVQSRLGLSIRPFREMRDEVWHPIFRQIYTYVEVNGKPQRAEVFNANYGMNRGLSAACFFLGFIAHWMRLADPVVSIAIAIAGVCFAIRMRQFGIHYTREVFVQFLSIKRAS